MVRDLEKSPILNTHHILRFFPCHSHLCLNTIRPRTCDVTRQFTTPSQKKRWLLNKILHYIAVTCLTQTPCKRITNIWRLPCLYYICKVIGSKSIALTVQHPKSVLCSIAQVTSNIPFRQMRPSSFLSIHLIHLKG